MILRQDQPSRYAGLKCASRKLSPRNLPRERFSSMTPSRHTRCAKFQKKCTTRKRPRYKAKIRSLNSPRWCVNEEEAVMTKFIVAMFLAGSLLMSCAFVPIYAVAQTSESPPPLPGKPNTHPTSCIGPICRSGCRPFGRHGNQICKINCRSTGEYIGPCQTAVGCPLPC